MPGIVGVVLKELLRLFKSLTSLDLSYPVDYQSGCLGGGPSSPDPSL